jgi:hypothetical protein
MPAKQTNFYCSGWRRDAEKNKPAMQGIRFPTSPGTHGGTRTWRATPPIRMNTHG